MIFRSLRIIFDHFETIGIYFGIIWSDLNTQKTAIKYKLRRSKILYKDNYFDLFQVLKNQDIILNKF